MIDDFIFRKQVQDTAGRVDLFLDDQRLVFVQILLCHHGHHTRQRPGFTDIETADTRMRVFTADKHTVQHPRQFHIGRILCSARHLGQRIHPWQSAAQDRFFIIVLHNFFLITDQG